MNMVDPANKNKKNVSYSVNESLVTQVHKTMEEGDFSSFSDFLNTALINFFAKYEILKAENYEDIYLKSLKEEREKAEKLKQRKTKISVTLNSYVIKKVKNAKYEMKLDTYSDVVTFALHAFLKTYQEFKMNGSLEYRNGSIKYEDLKTQVKKMAVSEEELKSLIYSEVKDIIEKHYK
ncbi:MAG: hypothetical protein GX362_04055 [Methanosarcinaceae archaeon]|nr:hypothetical protein [Methanosarcinaceae archaeon]